jgi:hypothetical protein
MAWRAGLLGLVAVLTAACGPAEKVGQPPTTAPVVGSCIERPADDVLDRTAGEPAEVKIRPVPCDQRPNLRVTEHLAASAAFIVGDPSTGRAGGPNCDPPAKRWALVSPPGSRQVVICLADQP